jgi:plasmid stability protein
MTGRGSGWVLDKIFVLHYYCDMKNVTITLDEEVARWARIKAAEDDKSLSRLVRELLSEKMRTESEYRTAMENYLARSPRLLKKKADKYPSREEIHDRPSLR